MFNVHELWAKSSRKFGLSFLTKLFDHFSKTLMWLKISLPCYYSLSLALFLLSCPICTCLLVALQLIPYLKLLDKEEKAESIPNTAAPCWAILQQLLELSVYLCDQARRTSIAGLERWTDRHAPHLTETSHSHCLSLITGQTVSCCLYNKSDTWSGTKYSVGGRKSDMVSLGNPGCQQFLGVLRTIWWEAFV